MLIVPISTPSLSIGTTKNVRAPPRSTEATTLGSPSRYARSARASLNCTARLVLTTSACWLVLHRGKCRRYVVNCSVPKDFSVIQVQRAKLGTAEPRRVRQYTLEHGLLEMTRRISEDRGVRRGVLVFREGGHRFPCRGVRSAPPPAESLQVAVRLHDFRLIPSGGDQRNFPSFSRETASET